jgi:D-alanine-D-alanine ligase
MKNIAVVTGGFSGEDVISRKSAQMVLNNIDRKTYHPFLIDVSKKGWFYIGETEKNIPIDKNDFSILLGKEKVIFDAVFMALHGDPGENGVLQSYFDLIGIPYTTGAPFSMTITFNKYATIQMLKSGNLPVADSVLLRKDQRFDKHSILQRVGLPCFVKPNFGGSSLGISKVTKAFELSTAISTAFKESNEVIIEAYMSGREFTCGVLQEGDKIRPIAVTEIISKNDFFDYESKYNTDLVDEITPAEIDKKLYRTCQELAEDAFRLLNCKGMARVDFIHTKTGLKIIEINTVPGLTELSIYPEMAIASGISKKEMIGTLLSNIL